MRYTRPVLTVKQAAIRLGIHPSLVRRLVKAGRIKGIKLGRDWVIQPEALTRYEATPRRGSVRSPSSPALHIKAASATRRKYARNA